MHFSKLFLGMCACAAMCACSNDDELMLDNENQNGVVGDVNTSFLSVKIVSATANSRATEDASNYEDGTVAGENAVTGVRFYFFDGNDDPALVKKSGESMVNYYDWTPEENGQDMPNIEKILTATIVINTAEGDEVPTSMVAIVNPRTLNGIDDATALSLTDLNGIVDDYRNHATDGGGTEPFIMTNSVYAEGGAKMEAVKVKDFIYSASEAALLNPVKIYVERVLAKVRMNAVEIADAVTLSDGVTLYPTFSTTQEEKFNGKDIYVKFLGWNVTATADKSRLMKEINPAWAAKLFGDEDWNYDPYFRSFWAVNPTGLNFNYGTFNVDVTDSDDVNKASAITYFKSTDADGKAVKNYAYVQENAAKSLESGADTDTPTQVIIAAQLVDKDGNAMEFAEWAFQKYSVDDLKKVFANSSKLTYKIKGEAETKTGDITLEDIDFKTATEMNLAANGDRYYVYAQLSADVDANKVWYVNGTEVNANDVLKDLGPAKIWKSGYTYYYFDIAHLNKTDKTKPGYNGVVRNHLYNVNIKSLVGLGTPVYKPEEVIIPEKPRDENTYIAAQINILSWRLVPNDVEFTWP